MVSNGADEGLWDDGDPEDAVGSELTRTLPDGTVVPTSAAQLDQRVARLAGFIEDREDEDDDLLVPVREAYAICLEFARERTVISNRFQHLDKKYREHLDEGTAAIARRREALRAYEIRQHELEKERDRLIRYLEGDASKPDEEEDALEGVARVIRAFRPPGERSPGAIDMGEELTFVQRQATAGDVALRRTRRDLAMAQGDCRMRARTLPGPLSRRRARSLTFNGSGRNSALLKRGSWIQASK